MKFITDKSGAPLVKFSDAKYIHVLPVTKYQFERFVWQVAPSWCDYEALIPETSRVSTDAITPDNFPQAFLVNVNFEEVLSFFKWSGSRPAAVKEWDEACEKIFAKKELFKEAYVYMNKAFREGQKVDRRISKLLKKLCDFKIRRQDLNCKIGELACEFSKEPYGKIYLKQDDKSQGLVTGSPRRKARGNNFGFCGVMEQ